MPGQLDGFGLARRLKEDPSRPADPLTTAYSDAAAMCAAIFRSCENPWTHDWSRTIASCRADVLARLGAIRIFQKIPDAVDDGEVDRVGFDALTRRQY